MKTRAERREHYYYVTKQGGVMITKSFNKKQLRKELAITESSIVARFRHFTDAYAFSCAYADNMGYKSRPYYRSLTNNDAID